MNHPINSLIDEAMKGLRDMVDTNTVIGKPVQLPNGVTAIPICKVALGYASGGSDLPTKTDKELFGGGNGGGVTITPIAFLVTDKDGVKLLQLDTIGTTADNIVRAVPDVIDKVTGMIQKSKNDQ
jgi:sporulation protein YtfJ